MRLDEDRLAGLVDQYSSQAEAATAKGELIAALQNGAAAHAIAKAVYDLSDDRSMHRWDTMLHHTQRLQSNAREALLAELPDTEVTHG